MTTYDPWGRLNRFTYRFNARFDEAVFLPVANGYRRMPSPLRSGVHNFFGNLAELDSIVNYTLQGRLGRTVRSVGRFVINSTIGIGGLLDLATNSFAEGADRLRDDAREVGHAPGTLSGHSVLRTLDAARGHRTRGRLWHALSSTPGPLSRRAVLGTRRR